MLANPYTTPQSPVSDDPLSRERRLYELGRGQRALQWLMLAALAAWMFPLLRLFVGLLCVLLSYRSARHVYPAPIALAVCVLCGLPGIGLLALAAIHSRGLLALRAAGVPIGWLGADVAPLRSALEPRDPRDAALA